jgi:adenylate kinase family enzyme
MSIQIKAIPAQEDASAHVTNLRMLYRELNWLEEIISQVICSYLKHDGHERDWQDILAPQLEESTYAKFVRDCELDKHARVALALAMAPCLRPEMLDIFFGQNALYDRGFSEFGGVTDKAFSGFLPTGQTLNFILSANDPDDRLKVMVILDPSHRLLAEQVLSLQSIDANMPAWSGVLTLSDQWLHYFITGEKVRPELSSAFPAHPISSPLDWSDLVLNHNVMTQIQEIKSWLTHGETLMQDWNLAKKIKPGYRALFYGPPGTGKTLTAALLAKSTGREIYRVDLSMIVSKYIGETEKNLARVFDAAAYKNWILFFDEADALFGQRTAASNSNDRHANQQTGYLLQRIEDFPGVVILASNLKSNMDEAFTRRFQSMIHFPMPSAEERLALWRQAFRDTCDLDKDVDLVKIAAEYELAGGAIINVLRHCALTAIERGSKCVKSQDILTGIRQEFRKDNKTIRVG